MQNVIEFLEGLNPSVQILSALGAAGVAWRLVRGVFKWFPALPDGVSKDEVKRREKILGIPFPKPTKASRKRLMEGQWGGERFDFGVATHGAKKGDLVEFIVE